MNHLWKATVTRRSAEPKLAVGMFAEVVVENNTGKPTNTAIANAFNEKYGAGTAHFGTIGGCITIEKM